MVVHTLRSWVLSSSNLALRWIFVRDSPSKQRSFATSRIPGPKSYPFIGSLPAIISDKDFDKQKIYIYFQKLLKTYGPIVKVQFPGNPPLVLVQEPEDVRKLHLLTGMNPVRNGMLSMKKAKYNNPYYEKKGGIVVEDGDEWWRVRSKVQAPVMKLKNVNIYAKDMDLVTQDFLEKIIDSRDETGEVTIDFLEELRKWALECMCLVSLNQRIGCFANENDVPSTTRVITKTAQEYVDAIFECESGSKAWKFYRTEPFRRMEESLDILTKICEDVLREAESKLISRTKPEHSEEEEDLTLIDHLLLKGEGLTRKDILTFMLDIIPGGTSTTSDNVAVILYQLAKNPLAQRKLQEELDRVLGDGLGPLTGKQLAQLSYARACMKEANRVMPPMFGPVRILQEDTQLHDYRLEKGWTVLFLNGLLGWEESVFPQADQFLPDRWLRDRPLGDFHPNTIQPFSHGKRMCVGRRLAEQMIYIILARTFHRYNVEWKHEDMVRDFKFVFSPKGPLRFTITERQFN